MRQRKQRRDKIARLISWGHWFTFFNILLALAIGTLYIEAAETPASFLGGFYMLISWLGHFAFLPFVVFILLIFPFCLIVPFSKILKGIATLVAAFGLVALIADALFFRQYGYHFNTYSLSQLALDAESNFTGASFVLLLGLLGIFVILLVLELGVANVVWKRLDTLREKRWGASAAAVFVLCFLTSHSLHIWADAVFYAPITKQDDLFPVSYPTTARTLMFKQGWLVEERLQATDRLLKEASTVNLDYPPRPLMCARQPHTDDTLIVVFNQLTEAQQQQIQREFPQLTASQTPVVGQLSPLGGAFEVLYGLADIYANQIFNEQRLPTFWQQLNDYQVQVQLDGDFAAFALPDYLQQQDEIAYRDTIAVRLSTSLDATLRADISAALANHNRVIITALTPSHTLGAGIESYAVSEMQVPLYHSAAIAFAAQDVVLLTDLMPTVVSYYMSCSDGVQAFATGKNILAPRERRFPVMTTFNRTLVIYDRDTTTVIGTDGHMQSFDNTTFAELPSSSPATPVLVDGLKHLQRFNKKTDE